MFRARSAPDAGTPLLDGTDRNADLLGNHAVDQALLGQLQSSVHRSSGVHKDSVASATDIFGYANPPAEKVPEAGFEPACSLEQTLLRRPCKPIPPFRHILQQNQTYDLYRAARRLAARQTTIYPRSALAARSQADPAAAGRGVAEHAECTPVGSAA
jgi:hypothetical protein